MKLKILLKEPMFWLVIVAFGTLIYGITEYINLSG